MPRTDPGAPDAGVGAPDASTQRPDARPLGASTTQDADRSPDTGAAGRWLDRRCRPQLDASACRRRRLRETPAEPPGYGQFVRFTLHGTVTWSRRSTSTASRLWRRLVNKPVRVVITYDATVADSRQQGDYGQYRQPSETTNMAITLESIRETYSQPEVLFVEPFNNFQSQGDRLKFVGNYQLQLGTIGQAVVDFHDASAAALDSIALPDTVGAHRLPSGRHADHPRSTLGDPGRAGAPLGVPAAPRGRGAAGGEVGQCLAAEG